MERTFIASLILCASLAAAGIAQKAETPEALLGAAIHQEEAEGNLEAAIASYKKFLSQHGTNRPLAARAQYRLGLVYEKLGGAEARKAYETVVRDYADQPQIAAEARRRLAALGAARPPDALAARRVLPHNDGVPTAYISPDNRFVAMTDWDNGDLSIREMPTGQAKRLLAKSGSWESSAFADSPVVSGDQRQVAYIWNENGAAELRVMPNSPGARSRVVVKNPEFDYVVPTAWSSDAKSILATLWKRDGTSQFGWVSAADGSIKVLKSLEWRWAGDPQLSPDGRYIAYSALVRSGSPDSHIYVLAADGSRETELVNSSGVNKDPIWTSDGSHILFPSDRSGTFGLWSIAMRDGRAAGTVSLVKPDIGRIAPRGFTRSGSYYYVHEISDENVFIADADPATMKLRGPAVRLSEKFVGFNRTPSWSPDGKFIAFKRRDARTNPGLTRGYDLVVRSVETGEEKTYTSNLTMGAAQRPQWFPDGQGILVDMLRTQGGTSFHRVDRVTGQYKEIVVAPDLHLDTRAALSLDGKILYGTSDSSESGRTRVIAVDLATGQQRSAFSVPSIVMSLAVSPDGRWLAIMQRGQGKTVLARVAVDGGDYRELYTAKALVGLFAVAWTKDGGAILFQSPEGEKPQLMRVPADGGPAAPIGLAMWNRHSIDISPDGSRLAFSDGQFAIRELWALDNVLSVLKTHR